jgi:hypothetical protein
MKHKNIASSRYFTFSENMETVHAKNVPKSYHKTLKEWFDMTREIRDPYKFRSGAIYDGEWKGKFRDG